MYRTKTFLERTRVNESTNNMPYAFNPLFTEIKILYIITESFLTKFLAYSLKYNKHVSSFINLT